MTQTQEESCSAQEPLGQLLDEMGSESMSQFAKVLTLLAQGKPVAVGKVAEGLGMLEKDAKTWLVKYGAEFNNSGEVVGLGLTSVPTPHAFEVDGHHLYAWCAGDTLIFPVILGKTARVESTDPISGARIRLIATPEGVQNLQPATALLSWPKHADSADIRGSVCYPSLWFASEETARKYASENEGVTIRNPEEFREFLQVIPGKIRIAAGHEERSTTAPPTTSERPKCH